MFTDLREVKAFSGFSVDDLAAALKFYKEVLGVDVEETAMGLILKIAGGNGTFVYPKQDHVAATFTILNFPVDNIDEAVEALTAKGVIFEQYPPLTDDQGIARGLSRNQGPDIAWFKDPAGNVLSILQQS
jgi:predicted enzyme related to lactoylglutathione lyase